MLSEQKLKERFNTPSYEEQKLVVDGLKKLMEEELAFPDKARQLVYDYVIRQLRRVSLLNKSNIDPAFSFTIDEIRLVWFCKTIQNWKALVVTTLPDDVYYEVTHNGDKNETYIDVYEKIQNVVVAD